MYMRRWFFNFCGALLWKFKFLLASMKTLTYFEDPNQNPLQKACCCIQEAACDSVNCSVSWRWWWKILNFLKRVSVLLFRITGRWLAVSFFKGGIEVSNSLWGAARVGNYDAASCKISRISKCFHRSKQELKKYFSWQFRCKKFKTIGAYTESTALTSKKNISSRASVPLKKRQWLTSSRPCWRPVPWPLGRGCAGQARPAAGTASPKGTVH